MSMTAVEYFRSKLYVALCAAICIKSGNYSFLRQIDRDGKRRTTKKSGAQLKPSYWIKISWNNLTPHSVLICWFYGVSLALALYLRKNIGSFCRMTSWDSELFVVAVGMDCVLLEFFGNCPRLWGGIVLRIICVWNIYRDSVQVDTIFKLSNREISPKMPNFDHQSGQRKPTKLNTTPS